MKTRWLRLYTEVMYDPKVLRLPAETFRAWILILCAVKEGESEDGSLPDAEDTAFLLHMSNEEYAGHLEVLEKRGLLENGRIHAWNTRQFQGDEDPTNAERQRRYREKKAAQKAEPQPAPEPEESEKPEEPAPAPAPQQLEFEDPVPAPIPSSPTRTPGIFDPIPVPKPQQAPPAAHPLPPALHPVAEASTQAGAHESSEIAIEYYKRLAKAGGILKMPQGHDYKNARMLSDALGGIERARPHVTSALDRYFSSYAELWFARKGQAPPFKPDWSFHGFCRHFDEILGPQAGRSAWRDNPAVKRMLEEV